MTERGLVHVLPIGDEREHVEEMLCPCMPTLVAGVLRHNSYDKREVGEVCRRAIDLLGMALADEGHEWSDEETEAVDHAVAVLGMHWPPSNDEPAMEGRRK